ncbi:MAG: nitrilase-related carbon-nitrogen hydrolase [Imperialibacter sp.]|uniref:nitrilase-related carbon-nitrogen hydrolase n=1 Tax=Imperialibacter sp. TaxID=2038411 RepID=UPI0032EDB941
MKTFTNTKTTTLWLLATISFSLLSVKWMFAPAAWVAPAFLILLMKEYKPWKSLLVGLSALYVSALIGSYKVMPFPTIVFVVIALIGALKHVVPFILFRLLSKRVEGWYDTLLFPCLYVAYDYLNGFDGGGTWGSMGYTQVNNDALMQLVAVTGLWGVTFLVTWVSALLAAWYSSGFSFSSIKTPATVCSSVFVVILIGGSIRINSLWQKETTTVRVAGITGQNLELLQSTYEAVFGSRLDVDLAKLTQTSPELQELNKGLVKFIENPGDPIFGASHRQMEAFQDSMLSVAKKEAIAGARIVSFSEGLLFTTKATEGKLIAKARRLANENQFYLLLTMASIITGEVTMGSKYLENKALLIGPDGQVLNTFFKNKPVPLVEPSIQGDGKIPVIETPFGRIAISICYDADFPYLMRQAGQQNADIMLLPSGDWKEIAPYHAWMAKVRAIENGFSLLRPVSNATSIASDYHGKVLGSNDFSSVGEHVVVSHLATKGVTTIYSKMGDWLAWGCLVAVVGIIMGSFLTSPKGIAKMDSVREIENNSP